MTPIRCLLACLLLLAAAPPVAARTLEVGPGKPYAQPSQAAAAAGDGDRVMIAPGEYFDCAVWPQNNLTIEGASEEGTVITDKACQGKALFVISGPNVTVRNLTLTRARVPDGNGAGIRAEGKTLVVDHVRFINNQDGILSTDEPQGSITVRDSQFTRNGACEKACAHGIYAGHIGLLRVERTAFSETRRAHDIKSRALRTEVVGCTFVDGPDGTASYAIELPNGGSLLAKNNTFEKGPKAENHTAVIMIGSEGITQPTREIVVEDNTARADGDYNTVLVYNQTATEAVVQGNRLSGPITPLHGDGSAS
jgi:hypothetical protein